MAGVHWLMAVAGRIWKEKAAETLLGKQDESPEDWILVGTLVPPEAMPSLSPTCGERVSRRKYAVSRARPDAPL